MVMRFDPFRDIDRLTQHLTGAMRSGTASMPMDAYRRGDHVFVHFDLPGVSPESIELTVENYAVTVRAERRWEQRREDEVLVQERPEGTFARQLFLGEHMDVDRLEARYEDGVLTLSIPVAEAAKPRRIEVRAGDEGRPKAIDVEATESTQQGGS